MLLAWEAISVTFVFIVEYAAPPCSAWRCNVAFSKRTCRCLFPVKLSPRVHLAFKKRVSPQSTVTQVIFPVSANIYWLSVYSNYVQPLASVDHTDKNARGSYLNLKPPAENSATTASVIQKMFSMNQSLYLVRPVHCPKLYVRNIMKNLFSREHDELEQLLKFR